MDIAQWVQLSISVALVPMSSAIIFLLIANAKQKIVMYGERDEPGFVGRLGKLEQRSDRHSDQIRDAQKDCEHRHTNSSSDSGIIPMSGDLRGLAETVQRSLNHGVAVWAKENAAKSEAG